jgi:hypothetical protein
VEFESFTNIETIRYGLQKSPLSMRKIMKITKLEQKNIPGFVRKAIVNLREYSVSLPDFPVFDIGAALRAQTGDPEDTFNLSGSVTLQRMGSQCFFKDSPAYAVAFLQKPSQAALAENPKAPPVPNVRIVCDTTDGPNGEASTIGCMFSVMDHPSGSFETSPAIQSFQQYIITVATTPEAELENLVLTDRNGPIMWLNTLEARKKHHEYYNAHLQIRPQSDPTQPRVYQWKSVMLYPESKSLVGQLGRIFQGVTWTAEYDKLNGGQLVQRPVIPMVPTRAKEDADDKPFIGGQTRAALKDAANKTNSDLSEKITKELAGSDVG